MNTNRISSLKIGSIFSSFLLYYETGSPSELSHTRFTHTQTHTERPTQEYSLEFQVLFRAAQEAKKWGCIGNYPFLHFAVTIEVRTCPVAMIQVCCATQTPHKFPSIKIHISYSFFFKSLD